MDHISRDKVLLILEDRARWQKDLSKVGGKQSFTTLVAANHLEAEQILRENIVHVASLDIEISDEGGQQITASPVNLIGQPIQDHGIQLARKLAQQHFVRDAIQVVILSNHSRTYVREAFRDISVYDVMEKKEFTPKTYAEMLNKAFAELDINLALEIRYREGQKSADLLIGKRFGGQRLNKTDEQSDLRNRFGAEFEDLLCRLYANTTAVLLTPLDDGLSNAIVCQVADTNTTSAANETIVKIDEYDNITAERENFEQYVKGKLRGRRAPNIINHRRTAHFGGVVYELVDYVAQSGRRLRNFREVYQAEGLDVITKVLDEIFTVTCGNWMDDARSGTINLTEHYMQGLMLTAHKLREGLKQLKKSIQAEGQGWVFTALDGSDSGAAKRVFANPILVIEQERALNEVSARSIVHGDLNGQNILVDEEGKAWLIDFRMTGPSHIMRDLVFLDVVVRTQYTDATLAERLQLEEVLLQTDTYNDVAKLPTSLSGADETLQKAYQVSRHLRHIASTVTQTADMRDYHLATFFTALNQVRFFQLPKHVREHSALIASLITSKYDL